MPVAAIMNEPLAATIATMVEAVHLEVGHRVADHQDLQLHHLHLSVEMFSQVRRLLPSLGLRMMALELPGFNREIFQWKPLMRDLRVSLES